MFWKCQFCDEAHSDLPLCFEFAPPCDMLIPEDEFTDRVQLSDSQCIIDDEKFYVRGHLEIPIHQSDEPFIFSVWAGVSAHSFDLICERWEAPDRGTDAPYPGHLCSHLLAYPDTLDLKLAVQSRAPDIVPLFVLEPSDHPLSMDQQNGLSPTQLSTLAHQLLDIFRTQNQPS